MKALVLLVASLLGLQGCAVAMAQDRAARASHRLQWAERGAAGCVEAREEALAARASGDEVVVPSCAEWLAVLEDARRNNHEAREDLQDARQRTAEALRHIGDGFKPAPSVSCTSTGVGNTVYTSCQ